MRKSLSLFLLASAVFAAPASAAVVSLSAPAAPAGSFDVLVNLTNVFDPPHDSDFFLGYGFDVSFDTGILTYLGETAGPLFTDISGNPGIGAQVAGVATSILLGPGDFTEPLNLAILHFEVTGLGPTTISITADISNPDQGLIYLTGSDPISASAALTAAPEPGSIWLLGFGILGVCWRFNPREARLSGLPKRRGVPE